MLYGIIIIILIVIVEAIFAATDTAFMYINRAEIRQLSKTNKKAKKIMILMEDSNKFFGTIEIGMNMCELLASAVASITVLEILMSNLEKYTKLNTSIIVMFSVAIVTIILTYVILVFGRVLPKRIARNYPKKVAYALTPILWIIAKLNYPFERIIDVSTNAISKVFNIKQEPQERMTEKQLKMIIKEAKDEGVLASLEKRILMNTIRANNISAKKIMVPLEESYMINIKDDISKILRGIKKEKYTRIPVYKGKKEDIIGIFNLKDIVLEYTETGIQEKEQIEKLLREPLFIDKDKKIFDVFKEFQNNNRMIGIVVDEDNTPIGLVSMEDILEKLVGKMFDEDDEK